MRLGLGLGLDVALACQVRPGPEQARGAGPAVDGGQGLTARPLGVCGERLPSLREYEIFKPPASNEP
ncbi:MAG: hypothetical protein RBU30_06305 [Polyangia bacterium]|jgi:hypothetical protein|nr:hypothetical protein [Polyangia bacterium]